MLSKYKIGFYASNDNVLQEANKHLPTTQNKQNLSAYTNRKNFLSKLEPKYYEAHQIEKLKILGAKKSLPISINYFKTV